ncbi:monocarboxylate transporter 12 [Elysia marginata]|uniref:Monocarboxylate transporter 12 n=1 Tax=Elysia marginata TaxID=1093978 RepID=A0AAV4EVT1_9GAST|nr:monocarboxylate transporter 12 [Elysia marginata]
MEAATIASFVGIGSLVARTLVGFAATEKNIGEKLIYVGINMVSFLICMAADFLMDFTIGAYFVSFSYGLYVCPCVILFFTMSFYVLGYEKGASGYGIVLLVYGFASLLGPPMYAILLKIFGCTVLFKVTGLLFLTSALVSVGITAHRDQTVEADNESDNEKEEIYCTDDGLLKVLKPEPYDIFGSRNFELIISAAAQGTSKEGSRKDCSCLEEDDAYGNVVKEGLGSAEKEEPYTMDLKNSEEPEKDVEFKGLLQSSSKAEDSFS